MPNGGMVTTGVWRWFISVVGIAVLAVLALQITCVINKGSLGIGRAFTAPDFEDHIYVVPGGPGYRAGLRTGDVIDRRATPVLSRWEIQSAGFRAGEAVEFAVRRGSRIEHVTIVASRGTPRWDEFLAAAGSFWAIACGLFVGLRRPDVKEARILSLLMCAFAWPFGGDGVTTPWLALNLALIGVTGIVSATYLVLFASYAALFGRPLSRARQVLTRTTYAVQLLTILAPVGWIVGSWTLWFDVDGPILAGPIGTFFLYVLPSLFAIACAVAGFRCTRPAERARLAWGLGALVVLGGFDCVYFVIGPLSWQELAPIGFAINNVLIFVVPLVLTYSVLTRRVLDAGFALNRAAMFSVTTLLLGGLFAGGQWLANAALSGVTARNPFLQIGIAVLVFYIVRFSRGSAEGFVNRLFFAARQRRIAAVREIAEAVDDVTEVDAIPAFVVDTLRGQAGIAVDDGAGFTSIAGRSIDGRLSENDPLVVRLRSLRTPIPAGDGVMAIPMILRRRLLGILFARASERESELAPDEINALVSLALRMTIPREEMLAEQFRRPRHGIAAV